MISQSYVVGTLLYLAAFLAWLAVLVFVARALYRVGARRSDTRWWISVWVAIVLLVIPLIGLIPAGVVLFKDTADIGHDPAGG